MTEINQLYGRIRAISEQITAVMRTEPKDSNLAGWGQFLEPNSPVFQFGPYGTAAGIAVNQIAYPDTAVDDRVRAQLRAFWEQKPEGKLFPQNVRLAFTVLGLGKAPQPELAALRDEIATKLRNRQLADGSWSDAVTPSGGRADVTAWAVLALKRVGGSDVAVERGAKWLANKVEGSGRIQLLSLIGTAAAILGHPEPGSVPGLRARGFEILDENSVNREELISFFDYDELREGSSVQMRDYLCFPAFYPVSILINGLSKDARFIEAVRLHAYRSDAIKKLAELSDGHAYKLPAARFSSTVDQAIYALSCEQLATAESSQQRGTSLLAPAYKWSRKSLWVQFFLPLVVVALAVVTLREPTTVPLALRPVLGGRIDWLVTFTTAYKPFSSILLSACREDRHWGYVCDNTMPKGDRAPNAKELFIGSLQHLAAAYAARSAVGGRAFPQAQIICETAVSALSELPTGHVDCVVTSPPYFGVTDNVKAQRLTMEWMCEEIEPLRRREIGARSKRHRLSALDDYLSELGIVFEQIHRVLKNGATAIIVFGQSPSRPDAQLRFVENLSVLGFSLYLERERHIPVGRRQVPSLVRETVLVVRK